MIENDRIYLYFPDGQHARASELLDACEPIMGFLTNSGLPPVLPLHIVLDENLDEPKVRVTMIPHHEIRIPLRAPGVLEDGGNEADPWHYFLFMGLCAQGIFSERSGIPGKAHTLFGEIISPNIILPEWGIDGISFLLYEKYRQTTIPAPLAENIFNIGPIPELDIVSHHPYIWPGRFSYRIFGRPFIHWLDQRYGWEKLLQFIQLHGKGIIPMEIDSEAKIVFGQSWDQLWQSFQEAHTAPAHDRVGWPISGYWHEPFTYWNEAGVHPGLQKKGFRGRYGYLDPDEWLQLSEYDGRGVSKLISLRKDQLRTARRDHVWDPGPGGVAVSIKGGRPHLVLHEALTGYFVLELRHREPITQWIEAPPGVIQLSGPVMDDAGRIAVAGNTSGNWDIWLHDGQWYRMTTAPSIEMDPWLQNGRLFFSSDVSGRFQIHTHEMQQLTHSTWAATLPRGRTYLELGPGGWFPMNLPTGDIPLLPAVSATGHTENALTDEAGRAPPYSPLNSIVPNYLVPDLYIDSDNLQIGISTEGRDVSGHFALDTGVRYTSDNDFITWRLGGKARSWTARATRYPFGYTTAHQETVSEIRHDLKIGWLPVPKRDLEVSLNWRHYGPHYDDFKDEDEWWGSLFFLHATGNWRTRTTLDLFTAGSQSLYGEILYFFGEKINTVVQVEAGKTWGDLVVGHNSFRIGGNSAEGFFTQRPTRLFPLRGFDEDILDARQAVTATIETLWPLAYIQTGYKTLPLFLHNISLGTFIDCGIAGEHFSTNNLLVGAGVELVTGMELAWGFNVDFRLGLAWPLKQPDDLNQSGPVFLIQIGRPL